MPSQRWQMQGNYTPWYFGWANCDEDAGKILRKYYERPNFLPTDSESGQRDWIFIGTPGFGAPMHLDNVKYPSWQAQVIHSAPKLEKKCNFKSAKKHYLHFQKWQKINFCTRKKSEKSIFGISKLFSCAKIDFLPFLK